MKRQLTCASGQEQGADPQRDELHAAGCGPVLEGHASGADRSRPVLARLLRDIRPSDTLVVVRLDRLARSVGHLLAVIEQFEATRAGADPRPHQGRPERGATAATSGGNPGLRAGNPAAIYKLRASQDAKHLEGVLAELDTWLLTVRWVYPGQPWDDVVRVLNHGQQVA